MDLDCNTLKNLRNIIFEGKKTDEGKIPATQDMSDPKTMTDLLEASKTYGAKVDMVAKEIFGFSAAELTPEQWGKVKKVLDIVAAQAEEAAAAPVEEIAPIVDAPVVEEPIVDAPIVDDVPAEVTDDEIVEEAKKKVKKEEKDLPKELKPKK